MSKMRFIKIKNFTVKTVTYNAVLIQSEKLPEGEHWLPRSVLSRRSDAELNDYMGEEVQLSVHDWYMNKNDLGPLEA